MNEFQFFINVICTFHEYENILDLSKAFDKVWHDVLYISYKKMGYQVTY